MHLKRGSGSSVFEPLVEGGSFNFQLLAGVGHPRKQELVHTQSTTERYSFQFQRTKNERSVAEKADLAGVQ